MLSIRGKTTVWLSYIRAWAFVPIVYLDSIYSILKWVIIQQTVSYYHILYNSINLFEEQIMGMVDRVYMREIVISEMFLNFSLQHRFCFVEVNTCVWSILNRTLPLESMTSVDGNWWNLKKNEMTSHEQSSQHHGFQENSKIFQ